MNLQNTDFKTLVQTAQVQGLSLNQDLPQATRSILERADQAQRQLTSDELTTICQVSGIDDGIARHNRQPDPTIGSDNLVNQARAHLMNSSPSRIWCNSGGYSAPEGQDAEKKPAGDLTGGTFFAWGINVCGGLQPELDLQDPSGMAFVDN